MIRGWLVPSALVMALAPAPLAAAGHLPFVSDDYAKAAAQARAASVPLFVEAWAPW